jgi:7-carboxy-7-deazaguanine synthase
MPMSLYVTEIFYSIQGESLHAGRPCSFIRLSGCNLRCHYCDTRYAYAPGQIMSIEKILSRVKDYDCPLVEITGGEPLLQSETPYLANTLLDAGYEVLIETNGTLPFNRMDRRCCIIMDLKCPSSGACNQNNPDNLKRLYRKDQLKCVIGDWNDYQFARDHLDALPKDFPIDQVLFSPVYDQLPPQQLAHWILKDHLNVRMQLQLHKIIWPHIKRGV